MSEESRRPAPVFTVRDMPLVHADEHVAAFNKPSGLAVHRGWATDKVTAVTLARNRLQQRVYPVQRLDRATSGLLVFALSSQVAALLQGSFQDHRVSKRYFALVRGTPPLEGIIDHPVPRTEKGQKVDAVTTFRRIATAGRFSLVEACPITGRLHQIRRHLKHITHPVVGDVRYGVGEINRLFRSEYGLCRLALHATELRIPHPATGTQLTFRADIPSDLAGPLERLGIPSFSWK